MMSIGLPGVTIGRLVVQKDLLVINILLFSSVTLAKVENFSDLIDQANSEQVQTYTEIRNQLQVHSFKNAKNKTVQKQNMTKRKRNKFSYVAKNSVINNASTVTDSKVINSSNMQIRLISRSRPTVTVR